SAGTINAPFKPASEAPPAGALSWLSRPALLGAIVLLLAALVVMFLPRMEAAPDAASAPAQPAAPSLPPAMPLFEPGAPEPGASDAGETSAPAEPSSDASAQTPVQAPAPSAAAPEAAAPAGEAGATPPGGAVLGLLATRESWVEVSN